MTRYDYMSSQIIVDAYSIIVDKNLGKITFRKSEREW